MIRISYIFLIASFLGLNHLSAEETTQINSDNLYQKVFGTKTQSKKVVLDITFRNLLAGTVESSVENDRLLGVNSDELREILYKLVRENKHVLYRLPSGEVSVSQIQQITPLKITYFARELRIDLSIPSEDLKPSNANIFDELIPYYARQAVAPAPFSVGLNYKLEQQINNNVSQNGFLTGQFDAFSNISNIALENRMNYLSNRERQWKRQNSRLIYDIPSSTQRIEIGDVNYPLIGYLQPLTFGGVSYYKDFSLNPYKVSSPTSAFEFYIESRSLVKTYINNVLLKTEYMNPGRYSVNDIPLNNGFNEIIVESIDEFGTKKIQSFNEPSSVDLLSKGVNRYSIASGIPSEEGDKSKKYKKEILFSTAFFQRGITRNWTAGIYGQADKRHELLGFNNIFTSTFGNWVFDTVGSKTENHGGFLGQSTYQLVVNGPFWFDNHNFSSRLEYKSPYFSNTGAQTINRFDWNVNASYSIPFFEKYNIGLSWNYQNPTIASNSVYSYNMNMSNRVFDNSSLSLQVSRVRNEYREWMSQVFVYYNITFGSSPSYISSFYDHSNKIKRISAIHDTGNSVNDYKVTGNLEDNVTAKQGLVDVQYNTVLADIGFREEVIKSKNKSAGTKTSLRLLSALAVVHNGDDFGFSITRPISNSFVIFQPNEGWEKQKFAVQTSNDVSDGETGLFGEAVVSGLTAYQYRQIQLSPRSLDPGFVLGQESFVVYPKRFSGYLFKVGKEGLIVLTGKMIDSNKVPVALKLGKWTSDSGKIIPFFTDRGGEFFIEGIENIAGTLEIDDDYFHPYKIDQKAEKRGIINIGELILNRKEVFK